MEQRSLTLLVVEDEALIAMELEDMLCDLGHEVAGVAASIQRAVDLIGEKKTTLDAVLLDANLGGKSALCVAMALEKEGIPFIVTSGYEQQELRREGFDAPLLRKPYRPSDVLEALRALPIERQDAR